MPGLLPLHHSFCSGTQPGSHSCSLLLFHPSPSCYQPLAALSSETNLILLLLPTATLGLPHHHLPPGLWQWSPRWSPCSCGPIQSSPGFDGQVILYCRALFPTLQDSSINPGFYPLDAEQLVPQLTQPRTVPCGQYCPCLTRNLSSKKLSEQSY